MPAPRFAPCSRLQKLVDDLGWVASKSLRLYKANRERLRGEVVAMEVSLTDIGFEECIRLYGDAGLEDVCPVDRGQQPVVPTASPQLTTAPEAPRKAKRHRPQQHSAAANGVEDEREKDDPPVKKEKLSDNEFIEALLRGEILP